MHVRPEACVLTAAALSTLWMVVDTGMTVWGATAGPGPGGPPSLDSSSESSHGRLHSANGATVGAQGSKAAGTVGAASTSESKQLLQTRTASGRGAEEEEASPRPGRSGCLSKYPRVSAGPPCNFTACPSPEGPFLYIVTGETVTAVTVTTVPVTDHHDDCLCQ